MKHQCDEKRELFEYMRTNYREKGRSKSGKGEAFSLQQIQATKDEFDEKATLFIFLLKSLKQGQSRSLLTQAVRHHAAQLSFFWKAFESHEAVDPHVNLVTQQQHIDYKFIDLEDDKSDGGGDDYDYGEDGQNSISSVSSDEGLNIDNLHNDWQLSFVSTVKTL